MSEAAGDDRITVPVAARLLGLQPHTVYALIADGDIAAEQGPPTVWKRNGQTGERRFVSLRRQDIEDLTAPFIERARVKPGELRHLLGPVVAIPELAVAKIQRFFAEFVPPASRTERRVEVTVRAMSVMVWERQPFSPPTNREWSRMRVAQLRYEPTTGGWELYRPLRHDQWQRYDDGRIATDVDKALETIAVDRLGVFWG